MNICCNISNYGSFKRKIPYEEATRTNPSRYYINDAGKYLEIESIKQNSDKFDADSTNFASECKSEPDSSHNSESTSKTKAKNESTYPTNGAKDYNKTTEENTNSPTIASSKITASSSRGKCKFYILVNFK